MKFFARSLGKIIIIISLCPAFAKATDFDYQPAFRNNEWSWTRIAVTSGIGLASIIGISQLKQSEIIFASLYGTAAVYYSLEYLPQEKIFRPEDYVVPFALSTLAITNLTLLKNNENSKSTIASVNALGLGLTFLYWYNFEKPFLQMAFGPKEVYFAFDF